MKFLIICFVFIVTTSPVLAQKYNDKKTQAQIARESLPPAIPLIDKLNNTRQQMRDTRDSTVTAKWAAHIETEEYKETVANKVLTKKQKELQDDAPLLLKLTHINLVAIRKIYQNTADGAVPDEDMDSIEELAASIEAMLIEINPSMDVEEVKMKSAVDGTANADSLLRRIRTPYDRNIMGTVRVWKKQMEMTHTRISG